MNELKVYWEENRTFFHITYHIHILNTLYYKLLNNFIEYLFDFHLCKPLNISNEAFKFKFK